MAIKDWSTTPANNATVGLIDWAEGQAPSTVNDSARECMAQLASFLQSTVDIKDYGATGDGVTDDGAAIAAAEAAAYAAESVLYAPAGTYLFDQRLAIRVPLLGAGGRGGNQTVFKKNGISAVFVLHSSVYYKEFTVDANGQAVAIDVQNSTGTGSLLGVKQTVIEGVTALGHTVRGMNLNDYVFGTVLIKCLVAQQAAGQESAIGFYVRPEDAEGSGGSALTNASTAFTMIGCTVYGGDVGLSAGYINGVHLISPEFIQARPLNLLQVNGQISNIDFESVSKHSFFNNCMLSVVGGSWQTIKTDITDYTSIAIPFSSPSDSRAFINVTGGGTLVVDSVQFINRHGTTSGSGGDLVLVACGTSFDSVRVGRSEFLQNITPLLGTNTIAPVIITQSNSNSLTRKVTYGGAKGVLRFSRTFGAGETGAGPYALWTDGTIVRKSFTNGPATIRSIQWAEYTDTPAAARSIVFKVYDSAESLVETKTLVNAWGSGSIGVPRLGPTSTVQSFEVNVPVDHYVEAEVSDGPGRALTFELLLEYDN